MGADLMARVTSEGTAYVRSMDPSSRKDTGIAPKKPTETSQERQQRTELTHGRDAAVGLNGMPSEKDITAPTDMDYEQARNVVGQTREDTLAKGAVSRDAMAGQNRHRSLSLLMS